MPKVILMRGLPASGKSTYAKQLLESNGHYKRINRDLLREMADLGKYTTSKEKLIRQAELALAELFINAGFTPIVDDCNLSPSAMAMWQAFAKKMNAVLEIKDFTDVSLETCIERDRKRPNYVGEPVIRRMYRDFLQPKITPIAYDPQLFDALMCDIDGTLALMNGRNPYDASTCEGDELNKPIADILERYATHPDRVYSILLVSGRGEQYRSQTERWLAAHAIAYAALYMRPEGDNRKDAEVKRELYEQHIQGRYNVHFVLDDRTQMVELWRSLGLTCLQVADGDF